MRISSVSYLTRGQDGPTTTSISGKPGRRFSCHGNSSKWNYGEKPWRFFVTARMRSPSGSSSQRMRPGKDPPPNLSAGQRHTNQSGRLQQQQRRHSGPSPRPAAPGQSQTGGGNTPPGYCYAYHQGERCSGSCGYDHTCHVCNDDHRAMYCPKRPSVGRHKVKGKSSELRSSGGFDPHLCTLEHKYVAE